MNPKDSSAIAWPPTPLARPATELPPLLRSAAGHALAAPEHAGQLILQVCPVCATVQYPPRDVCGHCLAPELDWRPVASGARLVASTTLHHSHFPYFQARLPWRIALLRLDAGPVAIVHLASGCHTEPGTRLSVTLRIDGGGMAVLYARPESFSATKESS